jgi:hypothetical protein
MSEPSKSQDTVKIPDSLKVPEASKIAEPLKLADTVKAAVTPKVPDPPKVMAAPSMAGPKLHDTPAGPGQAATGPTGSGASKAPSSAKTESWLSPSVLSIAATLGLLAAFWNFSSPNSDQAVLDDTRAKLTTMTDELKSVRDAKASVDRALEETRARLTVEQKARAVAEKAVADAKAALDAIPTAALANDPSKPGERAVEPAPKQ